MKKSAIFSLFVILVFLFPARNINAWLLEGTTDLRDYQGPVTDQWLFGYERSKDQSSYDTEKCAIHSTTSLVEGYLNYYAHDEFNQELIIDIDHQYVIEYVHLAYYGYSIDNAVKFIYNHKCKAVNSGSFPNYENAFYSAKIVVHDSDGDRTISNDDISTDELENGKPVIVNMIVNLNDFREFHRTPNDGGDYDEEKENKIYVGIEDNPRYEHWIVIVGEFEDEYSEIDFWICKNSFGSEKFGDNGYFYVKKNCCDIGEKGYALLETISDEDDEKECFAKIVPRFINSLKDAAEDEDNWATVIIWEGQEQVEIDAGEEIYVYGDPVVSSTTTIPEGKTIRVEHDQWGDDYGGYTTLSDIVVNNGGILVLSDGVNITSIGPESEDWGMLRVRPGGDLIIGSQDTIKHAKIGILIEDDDVVINPTVFSNVDSCFSCGIKVYNSTPTIKNIMLEYNGINTDKYAIYVSGSSADASIEKVTIKEDSYYGLKLNVSSDVTLKYSDLYDDIYEDNIYVGSYCSLSMYMGNNNIYPSEYAINNSQYAWPVSAIFNYWGSDSPNRFLLFAVQSVSHIPFGEEAYENGAPAKIAASYNAVNLLDEAYEYEQAGNWMEALAIYNEVISTSNEPSHKRKAIKSIMRIYSRNNLNYNDVSQLIINELNTATGAYKASLDFILIDVDVRSAMRLKDSITRESKLLDAITAFELKAEQYAGTSMEVEMLSRIATLYYYIGDRTMAREYADMAFNINPGQECVFDAYLAAGMETDYDPSNYNDIYKDVDENFDQPPISPKLSFAINSISANPNPFNPLTTITYSIKEPSHVKLVIYSLTGKKVTTLIDKYMSAGSHSVVFDGSDFGSGVYLYNFESKGFNKMGKMLLMK